MVLLLKGEDYRASSTGEVLSRKAAYCKSDSEVSKKYYTCTGGICQSNDLDKTVFDANDETRM